MQTKENCKASSHFLNMQNRKQRERNLKKSQA